MKIFIDAGHNYAGCDTGAIGNGLREQDVTFQIAEALKPLLEGYGHEVKMSRNKITDSIGATQAISIRERAVMANSWGADLFISIHCNAYNTLARGTETLVYSKNGSAYPFAERVQRAIVKALGTVDRGVKERPDLGVLRRTSMPALLVETAFIDNMHDGTILKNHIGDFAKAICLGIVGDVCEDDTVSEEAAEMTKTLCEEFFPIDDPDGFSKALSAAKEKNSPLYWGYRKLLDRR